MVGLQIREVVVHVEGDALFSEPLDPAAEERGGFHFLRVNAAGALLEGFDAELGGPLSEVVWRKGADDVGEMLGGEARAGVAGDEGFEVFAVGEVEPAVAGDEELAADGAFGIEDRNLSAGCSAGFGGAETCGASSDDGDVGVLEHAGSLRDETSGRQGRKVFGVLAAGKWMRENGPSGGVDRS